MNKVMIIGNLGNDPEMRFLDSGKASCRFRVATSEKWTDRDGNKQEHTEWHSVTAWGDLAENCGKYLAKGRQVYVEGKLKTREHDGKYYTDVQAFTVEFLGQRGDG